MRLFLQRWTELVVDRRILTAWSFIGDLLQLLLDLLFSFVSDERNISCTILVIRWIITLLREPAARNRRRKRNVKDDLTQIEDIFSAKKKDQPTSKDIRTKYNFSPNRSSADSYKQSLIQLSSSAASTAANSPSTLKESKISSIQSPPKSVPNRIQSLNRVTPLNIEPDETNSINSSTNINDVSGRSVTDENETQTNSKNSNSQQSPEQESPGSTGHESNNNGSVHVTRLPKKTNERMNTNPLSAASTNTLKVSRMSKADCHSATTARTSRGNSSSSKDRFGNVQCTLVQRDKKWKYSNLKTKNILSRFLTCFWD